MALATTTLSSAVSLTDNTIVVASATSLGAGRLIRIDDEFMEVTKQYVTASTTFQVLRGREGTATKAHASGANVTHGGPGDWADPPAGVDTAVILPSQRARPLTSYSAAGAIALPLGGNDAVAFINGTAALAMTLANPGKDIDGSILSIVGNGKAAHTVTYTAGLGNAGATVDLLTFDVLGQCCVALIAANGIWIPYPSPLSGTLTAIDVAVA